jgi:DNA-binding NarL/FixJ family response regulator
MEKRLRILIVEDDALVSKLLELMIRELGHRIIGIAPNPNVGLSMASSLSIDVAIVDVNLGEGTSHRIVDILDLRGVPTIICSGYDRTYEPAFAGRPIVSKPFRRHVLASAIESALAQQPRAVQRPCK